MPIVILNGDFNFPKMKSWDSSKILSFLDDIQDKESQNREIGSVTQQTKILCDTVQDLYLHQIIKGATRKGNLLDLFFTSDQDIILEHDILANVLFLDHSLCLIHTTISS